MNGGGSFTLEDCALSGKIENSGMLTVTDGTVTAAGGIGVDNKGTFTMNSGTITAASGTGVANNGTLTINNSVSNVNAMHVAEGGSALNYGNEQSGVYGTINVGTSSSATGTNNVGMLVDGVNQQRHNQYYGRGNRFCRHVWRKRHHQQR